MRGMCTALLLAFLATAQAQEGFPLDGTWRSAHAIFDVRTLKRRPCRRGRTKQTLAIAKN